MSFSSGNFLRVALGAAVLILLATCQTPPPVVEPAPEPLPPPPPKVVEIDDDHKLVSKQEFLDSAWTPLPAVASWKQEGSSVALTLADGRVVAVTFLTNRSVRLWFPQEVGSLPFSPGERTWPTDRPEVTATEIGAVLALKTTALTLQLNKTTLAWEVLNGAKSLFKTPGGPMGFKKRLKQDFSMATAALWSGLGSAGTGTSGTGADKTGQWLKLWASSEDAEQNGPWAVPFFLGVGGSQPFGLLVDNSYQSYFRLDPAAPHFGTLNGGLDLVFWTAPTVADVVGGLTAVTGRAQRAPSTALTTGLVLPPGENGSFARKARLSVGQAVVEAPAEGQLKALGFSQFAVWGANTRLAPSFAPAGWDATFDDRGQTSLLARSNNLYALWETQKAAVNLRQAEPALRPWLIWRNGTTGSARWGTPEWRAVAGTEDGATLAKVFSAGVSGLGALQLRLNIQGLADPAKAPSTWRGLQSALLNPYLVLDAGPDPQTWYLSLSDRDKKRLKAVLDRRSALKPYLTEVLRQAAPRGLPAIKPLWFNYPGDAKARAATDEFLLGDTMLVAPAVDGQSTRKVYLPGGGVWFLWPQDEELAGGQTYDILTNEDLPALFVKAGSFTPVREPEIYDGKATYNPLTYHLFPGAQGLGEYSVDDGVTRSWESGLITTMGLEFTYLGNTMDIHTTVLANGPHMKYSDPYLLIRLHKVYNPKQVKIDGKVIPKYGDSFGITDTDRSAAWYENDNTLLLKIFTPEKAQTVSLTFSQL